jgi:hypothetical protein
VLNPLDWRCNLFSSGDRSIVGKALWIAPWDARINENIWLRKLPLTFAIRPHTPASEIATEGQSGWLRYIRPWEADGVSEKHDAELHVVLLVTQELFTDLWECGPGRVPQRIFLDEIEGFRSQDEWVIGDKIWDINEAEDAQVRIKTCTFQYTDFVADHASLRYNWDQVADVPAFIEQHMRKHCDDCLDKPLQYRNILRDLYTCISHEFTRSGEVFRDELDAAMATVERLVDDLDVALNQQANDQAVGRQSSKKPLCIWARGNPAAVFQEGLKSPSRRTVDRESLAEVARKYLQAQYLRSDLLEWIIVDAFVLYEIQEFGESMKRGSSLKSALRYLANDGRQRSGVTLFWQLTLVPMILVGWIGSLAYVTPYAEESTLAALLVFGAYVIFVMWLTGRPIFLNGRNQARSDRTWIIWEKMLTVYAILDFPGVTSPQAIRNALLESQNKGAIWHGAALAILDTAAARTRPAWLIPDQ